jgi:uncharacterized membrane protein
MNSHAKTFSLTPSFDAATIAQVTQAEERHEQAMPMWRKFMQRYLGVSVVLIALAPFIPSIVRWVRASNVAFTAPDFSVLATVPLAVQIHLATVLICLPLGGFILFDTKGTTQHKVLGRIWVAAMLITCISALCIKSFAPLVGPFGLIHLMVLWSLFNLSRGMYNMIGKRDLQGHLRNMRSAYWGLIIAGLFSFIPGRMLWSMFTTM